jgi:hypothetical protein
LHNPAASFATEHSDLLFDCGGTAVSVRIGIDGTGAALVDGAGLGDGISEVAIGS